MRGCDFENLLRCKIKDYLMANIEKYIYKNNHKLRLGYTTGSCAAAAAKAAVQMLLTGKQVSYVELMTPKGISLTLEVLDARISGKEASCAIEKDAGDDPDDWSSLWEVRLSIPSLGP